MQRNKRRYRSSGVLTRLMCTVLLLCLCLGMAACKEPPPPIIPNREYNEEEVLTAARELLPKTVWINDIFYGYGIPCSDAEDAYTNGAYTEADARFLSEHGIEDLASLRTLAREAYSLSHCTSMFNTTLESLYDGETFVGARRYFEESATEEHEYRLMVNRLAEVLLPDPVEYHIDTLAVTGSRQEKVYVTVEVTVTDAEDETKTQTRTLSMALIEEDVGWRFDELTGTKYSTYFDQVEE